jgi:acyl-CoA dehydrogenase
LFEDFVASRYRPAFEMLGLEPPAHETLTAPKRSLLADLALGAPGTSVGSELFSAEHEELRRNVCRFVQEELLPHAGEWDEGEAFPREIFRRAGDAGLFGLKFPPEIGGSGPDLVADAVVTEELSGAASGGVTAALAAHKDLAALYLYNFGSPEQHERWLRPLISGHSIGALAVTEPGAGSDVSAVSSTARRDGDDWVIDGTKHFITNGAWADVVVVAARTDPDAHGGLTLFVVEKDTDGFSARRMPMLGWRPSQTGELFFDSVRVPDSARLGAPGSGFYAIMRNFAWERLVMAIGQSSAALRILGVARSYAEDRSAFGRTVSDFEVWRHRFAIASAKADAGRSLTMSCLELIVSGEDPLLEVAMAKLFTSEVCFEIADQSLQVHGGFGYSRGPAVERAWRDSRLGPIGGGTSEIMKEIIGKLLPAGASSA